MVRSPAVFRYIVPVSEASMVKVFVPDFESVPVPSSSSSAYKVIIPSVPTNKSIFPPVVSIIRLPSE